MYLRFSVSAGVKSRVPRGRFSFMCVGSSGCVIVSFTGLIGFPSVLFLIHKSMSVSAVLPSEIGAISGDVQEQGTGVGGVVASYPSFYKIASDYVPQALYVRG